MSKLKELLDQKDHWGLMEQLIGRSMRPGQTISSPVRDGDQHPSFNIFRGEDGKVRWKDFAQENGDVYALAMAMYKCGFRPALERLGILAGITSGELKLPKQIKREHFKLIKETSTVIKWNPRAWTPKDDAFWEGRYGISRRLLQQYDVWPCESLTIESQDKPSVTFYNSYYDPMYVFIIGDHCKLYRPYHADRKYKYMGNTGSRDVFALKQHETAFALGIPPPALLITAGQKDALTFMAEFDLPAISFNSENMWVSDSQMYHVTKLADRTFIMYDNDETGRVNQTKLAERFPMLVPINIGQWTSHKDLSDIRAAGDYATLAKIKEQLTCR